MVLGEVLEAVEEASPVVEEALEEVEAVAPGRYIFFSLNILFLTGPFGI